MDEAWVQLLKIGGPVVAIAGFAIWCLHRIATHALNNVAEAVRDNASAMRELAKEVRAAGKVDP